MKPYLLNGGPLDGATEFAGVAAVFSDGTVNACAHGSRPGYYLFYHGELTFLDAPTQLEFAAWLPVDSQPTHTEEK